MTTNTVSQNRLVFLDNLRYSIVLLVVVLHVSLSYSPSVSWWYVLDSNNSWLFLTLCGVLDSFMMPVLFFIAGYFALTSQRRRTMGSFIIAKLKRLGIPLFFGLFFLVPVMPYMYHYTRTITPLSFWEFWQSFVKSVGDFKVTFFDEANMMNLMNGFNHHHLWFISLLLFFFIGFALLYQAKSKFLGTTSHSHSKDTTAKSMWIALFLTGIVISLGVILINYLVSSVTWMNFYNVLFFQPTRLPLYLGLFALGIYASSKNWFTKHHFKGSLIIWFIASIILLFILLAVFASILNMMSHNAADSIPFWLILMHGFVRTFFVLIFLVFLMSFTHRYWNRSSKIHQNLAASSYDIYLLHLPIVVILQFLFLSVNISIFFKFAIIVLLTISLSYGISHYFIHRLLRYRCSDN